jgi:predicted DNA-binding WGR domain protein
MDNYTKLETDTKYYKIYIQKDLFGNQVLTRSWGSKTTRRSNFKHDIIIDQAALEKHYNKLIKRRVAHKYELV